VLMGGGTSMVAVKIHCLLSFREFQLLSYDKLTIEIRLCTSARQFIHQCWKGCKILCVYLFVDFSKVDYILDNSLQFHGKQPAFRSTKLRIFREEGIECCIRPILKFYLNFEERKKYFSHFYSKQLFSADATIYVYILCPWQVEKTSLKSN
jgi:hypothetical protein